ncbi:hypothetical protein KW787_00360 [Candidatus Pacearchaeota archaeon]|nr:hypothetical protein [Candidatus Pacearchaeota archaeon]
MKRGASHIEAILAFVLFISFVVAGFYFFTPTSSRLADSSLSYATREIMKNISISIETYGVKINQSSRKLDVIPVDILVPAGRHVRAENGSAILPARIGSNGVTYVNISGSGFITLEYADDILPSAGPLEFDYDRQIVYSSLASSRDENILSKKRIIGLNESYFNKYDMLKQQFNLPDRVDFGFSLDLPGLKITSERNIPQGINIYSSTMRVEMLNETGDREFGDLTIKVW